MKEIQQKPAMDDLPKDGIDWREISDFIEDMLEPDIFCRKGWKIVDDPAMTAALQANSLAVLRTLYDDLYEYFFTQRDERIEVWRRMELFVRTKYSGLSAKALSRIIARYHIDDR